MSTIQRNFRPIRVGTHHLPEHMKKSAVRLSRKLTRRKAARVFGVGEHTVKRWRQQYPSA